RQLIGLVEPLTGRALEFTRSGYTNTGESRICRGKRRVIGNRFLVRAYTLVASQRSPAKVEVVGFGAGLIAPPAAPELQAQAIDDTAGDLFLDLEDVRQLLVVPAGPQRKVIARANQLYVDAQLLSRAEYRTFHKVIGLKLFSGFPSVLRFAFEGK